MSNPLPPAPAPAVAVGVPPTTPGTIAPSAVVLSTPSPAAYQTVSTYTSAPVTVSRGGTRGGPLGFGILPKLGGYLGCGGADPTPEYRTTSYRYSGGG